MKSIYFESCRGERRQCVYNAVYKRCNGAFEGEGKTSEVNADGGVCFCSFFLSCCQRELLTEEARASKQEAPRGKKLYYSFVRYSKIPKDTLYLIISFQPSSSAFFFSPQVPTPLR